MIADDCEIGIEVLDPGWTGVLADAEARVAAAARAALTAPGGPAGPAEVAVVLADDAFVRALNRDWRGIDAATNVLSFATEADAPFAPPAGAPRLLGDVALALETTRREAEEEGKALGDHLSHLVVHGILHLLGYDHDTDVRADAMERLEVEILARLGIADPYRAEG